MAAIEKCWSKETKNPNHNPMVNEIFKDAANKKFLQRSTNEFGVAFDSAFVLATAYLGGFSNSEPYFDLTEDLQAILEFPHDDLQFTLRCLYLYESRGRTFFESFAKRFQLNQDIFDEAVELAKDLSAPYRELLQSRLPRDIGKPIGHLISSADQSRRIRRIQGLFVETLISNYNIGTYERVAVRLSSPSSPSPIFYQPFKKLYFKAADTSIVHHVPAVAEREKLVYYQLTKLSAKDQESVTFSSRVLPVTVTHFAMFLVAVPLSLYASLPDTS